ncbi:MAG: acyl-CoA carboxylase subunit beta [Chloroflexi bacterium]|nr:acyl-CoA carboxylase subunit beta [Chloroflexota bacterium]
MSRKTPLEELRTRRERARLGGGEKRIAKQHAQGKLTARERIEKLLDPHSFDEIGSLATHHIHEFGMDDKRFPGDGVVTGFGTIEGQRVAVYAQDFTVLGGSFSEMQANKISRLLDLAREAGIPFIGLIESGGARIQEGVRGLAGYGRLFTRNVLASGVIPQIAVVMGPAAGGSVYSPALMDFIIMVDKTSHMFLTGPDVIKTVTGEDVTFEELGGARVHNEKSGVAHFIAANEEEALQLVRRILSYLPPNNAEMPPRAQPKSPPAELVEGLNHVIPEEEDQAYDIHDVLNRIVDPDSFLEVQPHFARNAVVGFARLDGWPVGIVANQPAFLAGVLDIDSSDKIARFVRLCDAYNLPVITFIDCPGFLPGVGQEHGGIIRHGAKVVYAYVEATVPKISIVLRKAIGGAYIAMSSKEMRTDLALAWPTAQIATMGAEGAVRILYRRELAQAEDPQKLAQEFEADYREKILNPFVAAELFYIDEVIEPKETRRRLIRALHVLRSKVQTNPPKKHGLMPV